MNGFLKTKTSTRSESHLAEEVHMAGLPIVFQQTLSVGREKGCICAVSRVAQNGHGMVTHVEWGVTTPWLDDWAAGPVVADVAEVLDAVGRGAEVFTLFPTATGFACGPAVILDSKGCFGLQPGSAPEWRLDMLARLRLPHLLN